MIKTNKAKLFGLLGGEFDFDESNVNSAISSRILTDALCSTAKKPEVKFRNACSWVERLTEDSYNEGLAKGIEQERERIAKLLGLNSNSKV